MATLRKEEEKTCLDFYKTNLYSNSTITGRYYLSSVFYFNCDIHFTSDTLYSFLTIFLKGKKTIKSIAEKFPQVYEVLYSDDTSIVLQSSMTNIKFESMGNVKPFFKPYSALYEIINKVVPIEKNLSKINFGEDLYKVVCDVSPVDGKESFDIYNIKEEKTLSNLLNYNLCDIISVKDYVTDYAFDDKGMILTDEKRKFYLRPGAFILKEVNPLWKQVK
jgi:hypothetical protein